MAKDYFQDILPPQEPGKRASGRSSLKRDPDVRPAAKAPEPVVEEEITETDDADTIDLRTSAIREPELDEAPAERSIRNISAPARRARDDMHDAPRFTPPAPRQKRSYRAVLWVLAAVGVLAVVALLMVALRGTSVSVIPRSQTVVFDETSRFIAYPYSAGSASTLTYTTQTITLEESEPVKSTGTTRAEERASGTITVFNDSTTAPYRLVKNTRFESADGKIFRAQSDIVIPGKSGTTPGQVQVSVLAEEVGEQYNIAPGRLTVPGLAGGSDFTKIYAETAVAFTGGFVGERPSVSEADLAGAQAAIRGRLEQKIREAVGALNSADVMTFPEIASVTFESLPTKPENDGARVSEKATVVAPVIAAPELAKAVARTVAADADAATIRIVGMKDFGGLPAMASSTPGVDPVQFTLTGQAMIIWDVNASELAQALAGRDQSAFQPIVTGFPGIQSATARIEPFWSDSFPSDATAIKVKVADPSVQ